MAVAAVAFAVTICDTSVAAGHQEITTMNTERALTRKQQAIAPISAATALGDMPRLNAALGDGLDAGLTVSEAKEILVQLYAYTGFPRSLNALGELMKVLEARTQREACTMRPAANPARCPPAKTCSRSERRTRRSSRARRSRVRSLNSLPQSTST
jgi:alkylhydroperoxidase/carboxymuconolactone decarboxylase family protein YurZ